MDKLPSLMEALGVRRGDVLALTGGGGKTTCLFSLAAEAAARTWSVLLTTTTRMNRPDPESYDRVVVGRHQGRTLAAVQRFLAPGRRVLVTEKFFFPRKIHGILAERVDELVGLAELLLVEADGSRQLPLKGHEPWEPVIPTSTTRLVAVIGFDVLDQPLNGDRVHRPERAAQQAGIQPGDLLTREALARLLAHPEGLQRGRPAGASLVCLITRVPYTERKRAREFASFLGERLGADSAIGNLTTAGGVKDLWLEKIPPVR